jgi:DNA-binding CsgD family transcriptional regulator
MQPSLAHLPLTRRERQLAAEILNGHSNRTIAAAFGVSEQTVRNQLTTLYRKLGVASRLELAARLHGSDER